jgi:hypothetical protein
VTVERAFYDAVPGGKPGQGINEAELSRRTGLRCCARHDRALCCSLLSRVVRIAPIFKKEDILLQFEGSKKE